MKYMPDFPDQFGSIQDARAYCRRFFQWYAMEHHHSGIALLTSYQVHHGRAEVVTQARQEVLTQAYAKYPERFVRQPPKAPQLPKQVWINPPTQKEGGNQKTTSSVPQNDLPGSPRIDDLESPRPVAPSEITRPSGAPATERGAKLVNKTSPEQHQQPARSKGQSATKPVPNVTPFPGKGKAGRRFTKKTASALH